MEAAFSGCVLLAGYYWQFYWPLIIDPMLYNNYALDNVGLLECVLAHFFNLIIGSTFSSDLFLWDLPMSPLRFFIAYNVIGLIFNIRSFLKGTVRGDKTIGTLVLVYTAASWSERESWDGFGVYFTKNLDMRRILNDYGFYGHPLRKDFPLSGYSAKKFSFRFNAVINEKLRLAQAFRYFSRKAPWIFHYLTSHGVFKVSNNNT